MSSLRGLLPQRSTSYSGKSPAVPSAFQAAWVEANFIMGTFKKNTAVTGFTFVLLSATDGSVVTTGTPTIYVTKDGGTQATLVGSATHEGNGQWSFNITATEMDADVVGLLITESGSIAINQTLLTDTSIVSDVKAETAIILADTNELQTNQGDWLTATGFATAANLAIVDTNVDAILVDTGTDGVVISAASANQIADATLNRDMSAISDTNARTPLNALRFLRNKYSVAGSTLTVTKEDDSTAAWTSTLTSDAAADPVTGSDPIG